MSLAILFHFLCAQHVSDINISIIRSLRLFCWITTLVILFLVRCVLEFRCGWVGVVSVLQVSACNKHGTWISIKLAVRTPYLAFLWTFCLLWWIFSEISEKISSVSEQWYYHSNRVFMCAVHDQGQWKVESSKEC